MQKRPPGSGGRSCLICTILFHFIGGFSFSFQAVWKYEIHLITSNKYMINQGDAKSSNVYIRLLAQAITPNDLVMPP